MTLLQKILPTKYAGRERFRRLEAIEILGVSEKTFETLAIEPVRVAPRIAWYTAEVLEIYLEQQNQPQDTATRGNKR